jgi:NAD(P)-dependent dehydrogenase (short-subunit alcohol dehydrogenase family)
MDLDLAGKRALVTGGGSGIGYAIAAGLAEEGVSVAIVGRRPEPLADAARRIQDTTGAPVLAIPGDTGNDDSVAGVVDTTVRAFGGVDILVNVASVNPAQPGGLTYEYATDEVFTDQLNVKVIGYLRTARAVVPYMIEQKWGRIINVSGIGVRQTYSVVNSVRNAGVVALSKNLADELGPHGITVNVIYPGYTLSDNYRERLQREAEAKGVALQDYLGSIDTQNALGRFVRPEEIAWVTTFLASPKSVTISGDPIPVGGGFLGHIYY